MSAEASKTVVLYTPWTTLCSAALFGWATEKDLSQRSENKSIASLVCECLQCTVDFMLSTLHSTCILGMISHLLFLTIKCRLEGEENP